jgi:hypothetical protein
MDAEKVGFASTISHNLAVLNRLRCAKQLSIEVKPILLDVEA